MKLEIIGLLISAIIGRTRRNQKLTSGKKPSLTSGEKPSYTLGNLVELSN